MQPEFILSICTPESLRKPPSMAISPNSLSISTIFSPVYAFLGNQLFDQRGLAGTEKNRRKYQFCHKRKHFLSGSTHSRNFVHYYSTKL